MKKFNILRIDTAFPTVVGTPADDAEAELVQVTTKTRADWPDNWHKLSSKWKGMLLAELVHKAVVTLAHGDLAAYKEFCAITGWGSAAPKKKKGRK